MDFQRNFIADVMHINSTSLKEDNTVKINFSLCEKDQIFVEHFEKSPILPGAYITEIIDYFVRHYSHYKNAQLYKIKSMSFVTAIHPQEAMRADLSFDDRADYIFVSFKIISKNDKIFTRGVFQFQNRGEFNE